MKEYELVIIGAGPAGLSAAVEAARAGAEVLVVDENSQPGGQLFKQIHKFFGSKVHRAGERGFKIGQSLLEKCKNLGVEVILEAPVTGIYNNEIIAMAEKKDVKFQKLIIAAGASEKPLAFPGWTLPGVMGAGAVQTMMNVHRVLPGQEFIIIGSGNVGLIVAFQLLQAGAEVKGIVEAESQIGGYGVHSAKLKRAGVQFFMSHTINKAEGDKEVEQVELIKLDNDYNKREGTEKEIKVSTVCLAVGLTPLIELALLAGCKYRLVQELGGYVPLHDQNMETSISGIYAAGDITGIEEASSAMEEGKIAGTAAAYALGYMKEKDFLEKRDKFRENLAVLRKGPFGKIRKNGKKKVNLGEK